MVLLGAALLSRVPNRCYYAHRRLARLGSSQIMVPTRGRTVPRFIGQAGLEVHLRPRAVDSASSHVMANGPALVCYRAAYVQA